MIITHVAPNIRLASNQSVPTTRKRPTAYPKSFVVIPAYNAVDQRFEFTPVRFQWYNNAFEAAPIDDDELNQMMPNIESRFFSEHEFVSYDVEIQNGKNVPWSKYSIEINPNQGKADFVLTWTFKSVTTLDDAVEDLNCLELIRILRGGRGGRKFVDKVVDIINTDLSSKKNKSKLTFWKDQDLVHFKCDMKGVNIHVRGTTAESDFKDPSATGIQFDEIVKRMKGSAAIIDHPDPFINATQLSVLNHYRFVQNVSNWAQVDKSTVMDAVQELEVQDPSVNIKLPGLQKLRAMQALVKRIFK